jgi:hypothetical protein
MESARLPRFSRADTIRPFRLTNRDMEILRHIKRHRFLRSSHICRLVDGSPTQILRLLQLLYHHGYVERPRGQLDYFHRNGSEPIVYGLGNKGVGALRPTGLGAAASLNWSWKNQNVGRLFLEHALLVSDVMVAFELAARKRSDVRLLCAEQLLPDRGHHSLQWRVTLDNRQKLGVVPDAVFALETSTEDGEASRAYITSWKPIAELCPSYAKTSGRLRSSENSWLITQPGSRVYTAADSVSLAFAS